MLRIIRKNLDSHILILDKLDKKIKFKRIFFLVANKKIQRGDHAHKKCTQAFFSVKGSFFIECIFSDGQKRKILIKPGKNLEIIYPLTWVKINLKKNDVCGVLCDRYYEEKDYIRKFKIFNKMINKI